MIFNNKYYDYTLKKFLINATKKPIFKIGNGGGTQLSNIYQYYNLNNYPPQFTKFINHNYNLSKKYNFITSNNFFLESREYYFKSSDEPFIGKFHSDYIDHSDKSCYTFIYYYFISKNILGGELEFENKKIFIPNENDLIYFDGDIKHRVNKLSSKLKDKNNSKLIRATLIMNIEKYY